MRDHAVKSNEDMVSEFIVGTCQLLPKSYTPTSSHMHNSTAARSPAPKEYYINCGSKTEFYIRPLNTCIDDIDFLVCRADELACYEDFPVLPSDRTGLADTIECYKIESCQRYPGFVLLRLLGEMTYNWKHKKYDFKQTAESGKYMRITLDSLANSNLKQFRRDLYNHATLPSVVTGPAIKYPTDSSFSLGRDTVRSIFCPQWPKEANNWPIRSRKHGWPTNDTIFDVVRNGCHVVYVQPRACRWDKQQYRLSFSVAEVILLQSWTQLQQIVYHLLRFFAKRELIRENCPKEDEVLCTYHLKTLMLWTCEEMPSEWWNSSSAIAICCALLQFLSDWLQRKYCPNYFIPEANLFHEPLSSTYLKQIRRRLNEFKDSGILSNWFLENYILLIIRTQLQFLNTKKIKPDFMDYMEPLLEYRKASELHQLDWLFSFKFISSNEICRCVLKHGLSSGLHQFLKLSQSTISLSTKLHSTMTYLPITKKNRCYTSYVNLLCILQVAHGLRYGEISWDCRLFVEFVQVISMQPEIIRSKHHNFPKTYTVESGWFQFRRSQDLMRNLTGSNYNSRSEFQLLSLLSEEFLRKTLEYDDCTANGIAPAAKAYLAALLFARSEYQHAVICCLATIADQTSDTDKESLNARCLLFVDGVATIVGLFLLHKKTTHNNLNYIFTWLYFDLRVSSKVFAHYLAVLSAERMSICFELQYDLPDSEFPMDKYLKASLKPKSCAAMGLSNDFNVTRQIVYRRIDSFTDSDLISVNPVTVNETVIWILMEYALENMTSFYRVIRADYGIQCNTADCYRASYFYKCLKYKEALNLCEQILHEPDLQRDLKEFSMTNVLLMPPLDLFFDGDMQSLLGFHTLFYFLSPHHDKTPRSLVVADYLTFEHWFSNHMYFRNNGLFQFLPLKYSFKCHYFLGRHFLARYLKVRCYIDCGLPYADAMKEFTVQKTNLPFEHIIHRFLQRKLRSPIIENL